MHPGGIAMVRIHGPGDDEELKRQKRLLRFGGKGSNALPLGNLRVSRASKADSAVALTPPNGRRVSLVSAKPEAQSQSFDFGRGDPLPPPSTRTVDATVQGSSSVRTRLYYDEELAHSSTLLHGQQPPQEAPRGRLGKQFTRSQASQFRSLANTRDPALLEYLAERCVSPGFLAEIDVFLRGHPDLARYTPDFVHKFNNARPLAAYRFFLKGYTRPARYIPGILPDRDNDITLPHAMPSVAATVDEELVDFFDGYEYRYDILHKIDIEVATLCNGLRSGVHLTWTQRLLVTLSLFGNPVDAYKHFEYNYQTEWLPHRYLPEHVVLSELPKQEDYSEPTPRVTAPIGLPDDEVMRTHLGTRARMARACDAGVDVIDVLLEDLVAACVKRGCRRLEAQQIKQRAQAAIDCERKTSSSVDIVDLVMGMVPHAYHPRPRTAIVQHGSRRGGRGTEAKKERLRAMRRTLETLGRHEKWLAGAYEDARLYGHSGWSEFMDLRHVRETRRRVEGQFVAELAAYMFGTGAWSQYVCKDVMSRFAKGEWDTGARGGVLQLAPVDL